MPIRLQVRPFGRELEEVHVLITQAADADLPGAFRRGGTAEDECRAVRRVLGLVLNVGAAGFLLPVAAVSAYLVNVALDRLAEEALAVPAPARRAALLLGAKRGDLFSVGTEKIDVDCAGVPAGDCQLLAVGAPGGYAAAFPRLGRDAMLLG